jgi:hypothetical protein
MRSFQPLAVAALVVAVLAPAAGAQLKLPRPSPKAGATQTLGLTDMSVSYSRPGVKGRAIWGGLVPYDKPWRTGANEATTFTTTDEITFGGQKLAPGTYSIVTIPGKDSWTVALNSDTELWAKTEYDTKKDVLRVTAKPAAAAESQEWMSLGFENLTANSAELALRWEKLRVAVPITADVQGKALANARAAMAALAADDWRTAYQAANYTFSNNVAMDEGEQWLKKSMTIQETHANLDLYARWQMKAGKKKEAIAAAEKAIAAGKKSGPSTDTSGTEKLVAEWKSSSSR